MAKDNCEGSTLMILEQSLSSEKKKKFTNFNQIPKVKNLDHSMVEHIN